VIQDERLADFDYIPFRGEWTSEKEQKALNYLKNLSDELTRISEAKLSSFTLELDSAIERKSPKEYNHKKQNSHTFRSKTPSPIPGKTRAKIIPLQYSPDIGHRSPKVHSPSRISRKSSIKSVNTDRTPSPCSRHEKEKAQIIDSHHPTFFEMSTIYYFKPTLSRSSKRQVTLETEREKIKEKEREKMELRLNGTPLRKEREKQGYNKIEKQTSVPKVKGVSGPFIGKAPSFKDVNRLIQEIRRNTMLAEKALYSVTRDSLSYRELVHPATERTEISRPNPVLERIKKSVKPPKLTQFQFDQIDQKTTQTSTDRAKSLNDLNTHNKPTSEYHKIIRVKKSSLGRKIPVKDLVNISL